MRHESRPSAGSRKWWWLAAVLVAVVAVVAVESSANSAPVVAESPSDAGPEQDQTPALAAAGKPQDQPPAEEQPAATEDEDEEASDEQWLVDEESGRQYRIEKIPKVEGTYKWWDEENPETNRVLFPGGAVLDVVKHDDQWFWVKYLKPRHTPQQKPKERPPKPTKVEPTEEELAATAASYGSATGQVDRLRFETFEKGLPRAGQWRNGFDVADMNGDDHLDIVFGPARKGRPRPNIFLGDGDGNWRFWKEAKFPALPYDYGDAAVADFNGDGHPDVAFAIHLRGMLVLVSDGKSGFLPWSSGISLEAPGERRGGGAFSSRALEVADWNDDGRPDLVGLGEGPKSPRKGTPGQVVDTSRGFLVYLNDGDGTWTPLPLPEDTSRRLGFGDGFALADFNRDQRTDIATTSSQMANQGIVKVATEEGTLTSKWLAEVRPNGLVSSVAAADLNGDGYQDLIVGYRNSELSVWRTGIDVLYGGADLSWTRKPLIAEESRKGVPALALGELDGDGHTDLVALTGEAEAWVFLGDGEGFFVREATDELTQPEQGCQGFGLRLADLDRDGMDEVIASFAGEPGGLPGLPGLSIPGCRSQGSVRAWKPAPNPSP
ncbi:MAG: VCBS repeat-containing protein [bacterium]|nr:VCBS repeat-containing protein [bacterium]